MLSRDQICTLAVLLVQRQRALKRGRLLQFDWYSKEFNDLVDIKKELDVQFNEAPWESGEETAI